MTSEATNDTDKTPSHRDRNDGRLAAPTCDRPARVDFSEVGFLPYDAAVLGHLILLIRRLCEAALLWHAVPARVDGLHKATTPTAHKEV